MHPLIEMLNVKIEGKHLLKHPFYVAWSRGELTLDDLRVYARQYFAQVRAFPVYLSEIHSRAENLADRKIIARNLAEEEGGATTHPELWLDFATGLSVDCQSVLNTAPRPQSYGFGGNLPHCCANGDRSRCGGPLLLREASARCGSG